MTAKEILAWRKTPEGVRWSAISRALHRDDRAWAFRLLCEDMTPRQALGVLAELIELERE